MYDDLFAAFKYLITPYRLIDWLWKPMAMGVLTTSITIFVHMVFDIPLGLPWPAAYFFVTAISLPFFLMGLGLAYRNEALTSELKRMALTDLLTGLDNRRAFFEKAAGRLGTILMVDVDRFKRVNDNHGHYVGDLVLQEVARHLERCLRGGDLVARFGGEEFAMLLLDANAQEAFKVGQRICAGVDVEPVGKVTLSVGTVGPNDWQGDTDLAFRRADKALYAAKNNGRACVVQWQVEHHAA